MRLSLILSLCLLSGCVHAQIALSNGDAISNRVGIILPLPPLCIITTNSLPGAAVGVLYSQTIETANCGVPLTFSIIPGALPSWVTAIGLNSSVIIRGTPGLEEPSDYVQISSGTAGDCHDAGATIPTSGQIIRTGGAAGTNNVSLNKDNCPSGATTSPICSAVGSSGIGRGQSPRFFVKKGIVSFTTTSPPTVSIQETAALVSGQILTQSLVIRNY
jgi:hypothetical protein